MNYEIYILEPSQIHHFRPRACRLSLTMSNQCPLPEPQTRKPNKTKETIEAERK